MRLLVYKSVLENIKEKLAGVTFQAGGILWTANSLPGHSGIKQAARGEMNRSPKLMGDMESMPKQSTFTNPEDQDSLNALQIVEQEMFQKASKSYNLKETELATMVVQRAISAEINRLTGLALL